jgi:hypothetical protein
MELISGKINFKNNMYRQDGKMPQETKPVADKPSSLDFLWRALDSHQATSTSGLLQETRLLNIMKNTSLLLIAVQLVRYCTKLRQNVK